MPKVELPTLIDVALEVPLNVLTSHRPAKVTAPGRRAVRRPAGGWI